MKIYIIFNIITVLYLLSLKIKILYVQKYIDNIITSIEEDILLNNIYPLQEPKSLECIKIFIQKINKIIVYLNQKNKLSQSFNSNVAHELKTPLSGLNINLEHLLSYNNTLDENMISKVKVSLKEINNLNSVISQMLLVSNNNIQELHTVMQRVILNDIIYEVINERQDHLREKKIKLEIIINQAVSLHGHQKLLYHAIINILDNAIKYSRPIKHQCIIIILKKKRKYMYFIIKDNGIGINKKELKLVFHPYYRGTNSNSRVQGYGLGLSLASWIFELHSAKIKIRSKKGEGTMIFVKFYLV